jgi:hypothetical protein
MRLFLKMMMNPKGVFRALALAALTLVLGQPGCVMAPAISLSVVTADGEKLDVPLNTAPVPVTDGTMTLKVFQMSPWQVGPDKPKQIAFSVIIQFVPGSVVTSMRIDDVTEAPIENIFDDPKGKVGAMKDNVWGTVTHPFAPQDEHINWILTVENSVRIYRLTAKLADGTTHTVLKPLFVPAAVKDFMRTQLGLKTS